MNQLGESLRGKLTPLIGPALASRKAATFCGAVMGETRQREILAEMGLL
ncbi:hypothetical protein [Bradyrhizobium nanningense]|nr:hypothetical protein [Bradyrhizobium nanningense]